MDHRWYIVHTYAGLENWAKQALEERVKSLHLEDKISEILVPSETVVEIVKGQKKASSRKFFPGYILVKMELNDETWQIVRNTPKITSFVGGKTNPPFIPDEEVRRITEQIREGALKPKPKVQFQKGESIRVIDGPFTNFTGTIDEVKSDKGKLRILVSIFGRATPVELEFSQVEKV